MSLRLAQKQKLNHPRAVPTFVSSLGTKENKPSRGNSVCRLFFVIFPLRETILTVGTSEVLCPTSTILFQPLLCSFPMTHDVHCCLFACCTKQQSGAVQCSVFYVWQSSNRRQEGGLVETDPVMRSVHCCQVTGPGIASL